MVDESLNSSFNKLKQTLEEFPEIAKSITNAMDSMVDGADAINRAFVASRTRLHEMDMAVAHSAAGIIKLGGSLTDVSNTISDIAEGSRRNVIATEEEVSQLYASYQLLGITAKDLVEDFGSVGYETSQIGPNIADSIVYIQSIGLNAKKVMNDVVNNMAQMNRYQFEGGVTGLAKMAAQASMLRFNMQETFDLAERVLDPEGAINTAAAFQRLGVSAGDLVDPFQLMNQSINDPSGLQNSLAEVAKQFTYFDEKTKSFKINPQGVLTLREMQDQTGVTAKEMSKMGLAAADLEKRISEINSAGLTIASDEDKQYLANIAKMQDGKYIVTLEDNTKKELSELTQPEFDKLIEEQKNAPKTVEEIQTRQLNFIEQINNSVSAIKAKGTFGVASSKYIEGNVRGMERITTGFANALEKEVPGSEKISEKFTQTIDKLSELYSSKEKGTIDNFSFSKKLELLEADFQSQVSTLGSKGLESISNALQESARGTTGNSKIETEYRKEIEAALGGLKSKTNETTNINSQVDFGGTITIKVDAPPGVSEQQFKTYFESEEFKRMIYKYYDEKAKELEKK